MKTILLLIPILVYSISFDELKKDIKNSLTYKINQQTVNLFKQKLKTIQSKKYGTINFNYTSIKLDQQPYLIINNNNFYTSDEYHYKAQLQYSYPLFNKNLNTLIKKNELQVAKKRLQLDNLIRILSINIAKLYTQIYALKEHLKALVIAQHSLESLKNKAKGLYENSLLNKADLEEIDAQYYKIIAKIYQIKSQKKSLLNQLNYLLNKNITKIDDINITKIDIKPQFQNRTDIKIIKKSLEISNSEIDIAKSSFYPNLLLFIGTKQEADNATLNKNNYTNISDNYIGATLKFNFDLTKLNKIEIAKISKNINLMFYDDYLNKIKTQFLNDQNSLQALFFQLKSAQKEINARKSYYNYIKAKFDEGLSDSSDLNKAIANLADAKAKKENIKANIFFLEQKLIIDSGIDNL